MRFIKLVKLLSVGKNFPKPSTVVTFWSARKYSTDIIVQPSEADVNIPSVSVTDFIWKEKEKWSQATALVCGLTQQSYTYGELQNVSRRFGNSLLRLGLRPREVLSVVSPNSVDSAVAILGTISVGGVITAVNPTSTPGEMARQLKNADVNHVVTTPSLLPTVQSAMNLYPGVQRVIVTGDTDHGYTRFSDLLQDGGDLPAATSLDVDVHDTAVLLSSSGTTGLPKGTMLTHYNVVYILRLWEEMGYTSKTTETYQEVFNVVLPFFHIYGMIFILFVGVSHGIKMVVLPDFKPDTYLSVMAQHKPTCLHLVTPLFAFLSADPRVKNEYFENIHSVIYGAAPVGMTLMNKMKQKMLPAKPYFLEVYGMTECCPLTMTPKTDIVHGSCGKVALNTKIKVIDTVTGESLGPNQTGEICAQGPQIMKGYLKNPEATTATIKDGWVHTGDIGYYTENGHFFVIDRVKELIKVKGMQVSPSELEDLLRLHPSVQDAGVIGVPDDVVGELPRAYIVKKDESLMEEDIVNYIKDNTAPHKRLKGGVRFVDAIPKAASGKILRRQLREAAEAEVNV